MAEIPGTTTVQADVPAQRVDIDPKAAVDAPPNTTAEENRHALGQRRVNIIWELSQAVIAMAVTGATLYVSAALALKDQGQTAAFLLLSNAFFLVIGFYFGRTNHQRVGGVDLGR